MLTKQDDFIGHQLPTTFDHVMSSDPAWMERLWYTGHPVPGGDFIFDIGLGWHPNRNVMDGFAGVMVEGKQYNFRASRRLRPNPLETTIGPLEIEILEGLRRHRLALKPNDSGLAFELEFVATMNPHEEGEHFRRRNGRVTEHMARAQQLGAYRGWIEVAGERREVCAGELARTARPFLGHPRGNAHRRIQSAAHLLSPVLLLLDDCAVQGPRPPYLLQGARAGRQDLHLRRRGARDRRADEGARASRRRRA